MLQPGRLVTRTEKWAQEMGRWREEFAQVDAKKLDKAQRERLRAAPVEAGLGGRARMSCATIRDPTLLSRNGRVRRVGLALVRSLQPSLPTVLEGEVRYQTRRLGSNDLAPLRPLNDKMRWMTIESGPW